MIMKMINKIFGQGNDKDIQKELSKNVTELVDLDFNEFETVFDVGAYHGSFTKAVLNKKPTMNMHLFEPSVDSYKIIRQNFKGPNVNLNNVAVTNSIGEQQFFINHYDETNSLLPSNIVNDQIDELTRHKDSQNVKTITLDHYCAKINLGNIDFIKVDTQGNTFNVLLGAEHLLREKRIQYLYIETEFIQIYTDEKCFSEIEMYMRDKDYQLMNLYNLNYTKDGRIAWCDCLFTIK